MKRVRMRRRPRLRIWNLVLGLCLWAVVPDAAGAQPSAACRDLAAQFADSAAGLDVGSLADLMSCVSDEIRYRTSGATPAPPPPTVEVAPPPAPPPPPSPAPPPSSFREAWPPSASWGSPWPNIGPDVR